MDAAATTALLLPQRTKALAIIHYPHMESYTHTQESYIQYTHTLSSTCNHIQNTYSHTYPRIIQYSQESYTLYTHTQESYAQYTRNHAHIRTTHTLLTITHATIHTIYTCTRTIHTHTHLTVTHAVTHNAIDGTNESGMQWNRLDLWNIFVLCFPQNKSVFVRCFFFKKVCTDNSCCFEGKLFLIRLPGAACSHSGRADMHH